MIILRFNCCDRYVCNIRMTSRRTQNNNNNNMRHDDMECFFSLLFNEIIT